MNRLCGVLKILAVLAAPFVFAASPALAADSKKLSVVATIFPQYDFAREITGGTDGITMLLRPGAESHSFDPTPQDIKLIAACDVFIYVGGESDKWADGILESLPVESRERIRVVSLMDIAEAVPEELAEGMQEDDAGGGEEPEYDEHVWTSPRNAAKIVSALADVFSELDEANAPKYRENAGAYLKRLDALDKKFESAVSGAKRRTIIFGDRFPFRYMTDAYGLKYYAAFPGCSADTEASAATIAFLIDKTKEWGIPVVFYREFSNGNIARAIGESAGARAEMLHSCHNISRDEFTGGATYIGLMERNAALLKEALN